MSLIRPTPEDGEEVLEQVASLLMEWFDGVQIFVQVETEDEVDTLQTHRGNFLAMQRQVEVWLRQIDRNAADGRMNGEDADPESGEVE